MSSFISKCVSFLLFSISTISTHCFAQTLGPDFASDYSIIDLGIPAAVPTTLGGLTFLDNDTLLIGGAANQSDAAIYRVSVTRDPVGNYINGFSGPATLYASAPNIDGGLAFGPGGVLFYTTYPTHMIGQIKPGSASPNKITSLGANMASSTGTLQFVPSGFAGAGQLKIASYNASTWHTAGLAPDGSGTFNLTSFSSSIALEGGPEGIVFVKSGNPGFAVDSILLSQYSWGSVSAYEIDGNGDPIASTRRDFLTGLSGAEGAAIDPLTGDFLFSTFGAGNQVIVVTGFQVVPEPEIVNSWPYHTAYSGSGTPPWNRLDTSKLLVRESTQPQTLTFNSLTNNSQGISGIVFDIRNLPDTGKLGSDDFEFQVSPGGAFDAEAHPPAGWQAAPAPSSISVTPGDPVRVLIQWPSGSIANRWLRITILANDHTGLSAPVTYYLGHLLGETTGPADGIFTVSFADITPIRSDVGQTVDASSITDVDKNGTVSFADISAMRGSVGTQLTQISVP